MKKLILTYAIAASLSSTALLTPISADAEDKPPSEIAMMDKHETVTLKAIKLDAKWCSSCKALTPKLASARAHHEFVNVAFSKIDYTDKKKKHFWSQAADLGIEVQLREFLNGKPKTGMIILFDTQTNQIVDVITRADSPDEMAKKLEEASA